ncbi:MAG: toprim domain-containing protein [Tenuifilaceae bacterium]|jgi:DNA primase|nr:toprim domain-containing protein [Tenuifilaceae bacterium]
MNSKLTIPEAKTISIESYLASNGIQPSRKKFNCAWYRSPIGRSELEKTPSLAVDLTKNRFSDFGAGINGDVIDLVKALHNVNTNEALEILSGSNHKPMVFSFKGNNSNTHQQSKKIEVNEVKTISHPCLVRYIQQRRIPLAIAKSYCKEIWYNSNGNKYFSLGFPNDMQGWELRSAIFKGCVSPKAITTIQSNNNSLNIFEGFFDFLSCLSYYQTQELKNQTIILNTLSNFRHIKDLLKNYQNINLFLDNDEPGEKLTGTIQELHPNANNISKSLYPRYNDFNDFILNITK